MSFEVHGKQDKEAGWEEEVCVKCTDNNNAVVKKDSMIFKQMPDHRSLKRVEKKSCDTS